jgi:hypothetical protein
MHVTTAAAGKPEIPHVAAAAELGPLFVQVKLPVTTLPATALAGRLTATAMSASTSLRMTQLISSFWVCTLIVGGFAGS